MRSLALICLFALVTPAAVFAKPKPQPKPQAEEQLVVVEVTGQAPVAGDRIAAKEKAKQNALRAAVEQVVGVAVGVDAVIKGHGITSDRVYLRAAGFVQKYDVVSESEEKGVIKVAIKAHVAARAIDEELVLVRELVRELGNRSIAVKIDEKRITEKGATEIHTYFTDGLTNAFRNDGWKVVRDDGEFLVVGDAVFVPIYRNADEIRRAREADLKRDKEYRPSSAYLPAYDGKGGFPAEGRYGLRVTVGDAVAKAGSNEEIANAQGTLRATSETRASLGINMGMSYDKTAAELATFAGRQVAAQIRRDLTAWMLAARTEGRKITMTVIGLADQPSTLQFKEAVGKVKGIKQVEVGASEPGQGTFVLRYLGTTEELAEVLSKVKWNKKPLSVTGADATTVEVTVE